MLDLLNFFLADMLTIVVAAGYHAAFISLGITGAVGLALYAAAMPDNPTQSRYQWRVNPGPRPPPNGGEPRVESR